MSVAHMGKEEEELLCVYESRDVSQHHANLCYVRKLKKKCLEIFLEYKLCEP